MEKIPHTEKDAIYCLWYFRKHIWKNAVLIGGFGKGKKKSDHDIDIYLPGMLNRKTETANSMLRIKTGKKISLLLDAKKYESTDWGGWFFYNTVFGNVDVFFDISEFDDAESELKRINL